MSPRIGIFDSFSNVLLLSRPPMIVVLPVGTYSLVASATEQETQEIADVTVAVDTETELDVGF